MDEEIDYKQYDGLFITLEGVHGCGKSTMAQLIHDEILSLNLRAVITNDQSGTAVGWEIRRINLESKYLVAPMTETLLFAAAKHQNLEEVIKPNLALGKIVVCERFVDAFFTFQGYVREVRTDLLECIHHAATEDIMPDITILLDIDPFIALSRLEGKAKHRLEVESAEYHLKLRQGYLDRARKYPKRIRVFEANHPVESVFKSIWVELYNFFQIKGFIPNE